MATPRKDWKTEWEQLATEARMLAKRANQRMVRIERYSERQGMGGIKEYAYKKAQEYIEKNLGMGTGPAGRFKENIKLYDVETDKMGFIGAKQKNLTDEQLSELYKQNVRLQRNRIKAINEFLESESSILGTSKYGIARIYDKRTETINKKYLTKYGLELSENDLKRFFDSKKQSKLESDYGSDQMFAIASVMKKYNLKANKRELEKYLKSNVDLEDRDKIKQRTGESFNDYLTRVDEFVKFTGDEVLDDLVKKALKDGINVNNIFI